MKEKKGERIQETWGTKKMGRRQYSHLRGSYYEARNGRVKLMNNLGKKFASNGRRGGVTVRCLGRRKTGAGTAKG